jgi:hypothetical protein
MMLIGVTEQFPWKDAVSHKGGYINGEAHELFIFLPPYRFILLLMVFLKYKIRSFWPLMGELISKKNYKMGRCDNPVF